MPLRRSYLTGLVTLGLALTACSGSGNKSTPPTGAAPGDQVTSSSSSSAATTTPPAPSSSSPTGTAPSHDTLAGIVVQQSDVPGYTAQAATPDTDLTQQQVVACVGSTSVNPSDRLEKVQSDDFVKGQVTVSSDASSFGTQAAVDALTALIQDPKAEDCLKQSLTQQLAANGTPVDSVQVQLTPGNGGSGPSNIVALLTAQVTVTAQGQQATLYVAQAFIVGREVTATVSTQGINEKPDLEGLFAQTVVPVATRAAAA